MAAAGATTEGSSPTPPDEGSAEVGRRYVLVFDANATQMVPLPTHGEIEIGRQPGAGGIRIDDAAVSRRHAKLVIGDSVELVDLGSQNGTRINGTRVVGSKTVETADLITIGGATLVYHADERATAAASHVLEFSQFRRRLEEELERVVRFQRAFGMLCVSIGRDAPDRSRLESLLAEHHRQFDMATWVGADELLVLMLEIEARDAPPAAARLHARWCELVPSTRLAYAVCPDDGCDADALVASVRAAALSAPPGTVVAVPPRPHTIEVGDARIVVADAAMIRLYALLERIAQAELPVLLTGETGTGKEIAARVLHARSQRRARPLVTLNCAALQETLVESELFGYERGAFSGAVTAKPGLLEAASGGTIFLDEIGELTLSTQAKLLRALETKRITRLGDVRERDVDIRLVAATNRDLLEEVEAKRFRRDLYFRLSGAVVAIPPLRQRPLELPLLARLFLDEACTKAGRGPMTLAPTTLSMMRAHQWPGNLRELKNLMSYVAAAFTEATVEPSHVAERLGARRAMSRPASEPSADERAAETSAPKFARLADELADLERRRITEALVAADGNHAQAARALGMPLRTLFSKVKRYKLG